ncbi:hypothetical protein MFMK1_003236 [Metallumcola ferriviriculae]|uniref:Uncharacterized protein n=1 Tax=Metallumcola ferriviriculae TaxID=3039180 RepID=A0AAU0USY7_9FIRM|nr:hypothetical protein MFMK1_003236 [Desulfitibacteraceae bacterium MK1]
MTRVRVSAGVCGFSSVIKVEQIGHLKVSLKIVSACKLVRDMNEDLMVIDCRKGVFTPILDSIVYKSAHQRLRQHTDCPVPSAVIKAIQVEIGGAVPKDAYIQFEE